MATLAQRMVAQSAPEVVSLDYDIALDTNHIVHRVAGQSGQLLEEA